MKWHYRITLSIPFDAYAHAILWAIGLELVGSLPYGADELWVKTTMDKEELLCHKEIKEIAEALYECERCNEVFEGEPHYDEVDEKHYCQSCFEVVREDRKDRDVPDYDFNGNSDYWREE